MGARAALRAAPGHQRRGSKVQLRRRPRHGEQVARRAHGVGSHAEGRLPALQGAAGLPPAVPERLRLPGPLDRGRRGEGARAQLQAGDRGVRTRGVRSPLPRGGRAVVGRADRGVDPPRPVDGLGERLLHVLRYEHRVHLALPADRARPRVGVPGPPRHGVVPSLRDLDLGARAGGQLRRSGGPGAVGPVPAARPSRRVRRHLDHHAVDPSRQCRRCRAAHRPVRTRWPTATAIGVERGRRGASFEETLLGSELVGWRYPARSTTSVREAKSPIG